MFNANFVVEQRKKLGLSVEEMAERLGLVPSVYLAYEKGEKVPTSTLIMLIAKELGVEYKDVRGEDVEISEYSGRKRTFDGKKLWDKRLEMGLSRLAMAEEMGVSRKALDNWEHNYASPQEQNVELLEKYCKVPRGYFDKQEEEQE